MQNVDSIVFGHENALFRVIGDSAFVSKKKKKKEKKLNKKKKKENVPQYRWDLKSQVR